MKKYLIIAALLSTCLVAGCGGGAKAYTDPGQAISVSANQDFTIALGSNPTTGYSWQESHDGNMIELVENTYQSGETAKGMVGAGGTEYFQFKALKAGTAEITMTYKRPWEQEILEQKVFTVNIE